MQFNVITSRWRLVLAVTAALMVPPASPWAAEQAASAEADAVESAEESVEEATEEGRELAQAESATDMVRDTSDAVLELIAEGKGYAKEDPERFYREVEALLSQVVDFESFARSVMSVHYRDATPAQRERFAGAFKWGLVRTYALALTEFSDGKVVVPPPDKPPRNPKRQTVKMEIHTKAGQIYPVLYSVTQEDDGTWAVRNLIVNGINMGLTYRSQFNGAMSDPKYGGDLDKVIDGWGELLKAEAPNLDAGGPENGGQES
jgi:phospholipid transport system substrate-binding protein